MFKDETGAACRMARTAGTSRRRCAIAAALGGLAILLLGPSAPAGAVGYHHYLAPPTACPGADVPTLADAEHGEAMLCMIDYARAVHGVGKLARPALLAGSSAIKADDIVRCGDVSHTACGRAVTDPFRQAGYITTDNAPEVNENLGVSTGPVGMARTIMLAWLQDEIHRNTLLGSSWRDGGVAVRRSPAALGPAGATVWVAHFGSGRSVAGSVAGSASAGGPAAAAGGSPGGAAGSARVPPAAGSPSGTTVGPSTSASTGQGTSRAAGLRLRVTPSRAVSGRRTRFRFVLSAAVAGGRQPIARKVVYFAGRRARTDARGRAAIVARLTRPGRYKASAMVGGARARATVVVVRRR